MNLIKLQVFQNGNILREIIFHQNLTIITGSDLEGNKIGKSTALRVINFCLGSSGESIWYDPIKKSDNPEIKEFVLKKHVYFLLELKSNNNRILLKRSFEIQNTKSGERIKRLGWINGVDAHGKKKYTEKLSYLFGHLQITPSYRQVKNRVVKVDNGNNFDTIRYLNFGTSDDTYRLIYSNIFNFAGENKIREEILLKEKIEDQEARKMSLLDGLKFIDFKKKLDEFNLQLDVLYKSEQNYEIKDPHMGELESLRTVRNEIINISQSLSSIEIKLDFNNRSILKYKAQKNKTDIIQIEKIYKEAKRFIPELQKTLEDVINFHNSFQNNKISYLENIKKDLLPQKEELNNLLGEKLDEEKEILKLVGDQGYLNDLGVT